MAKIQALVLPWVLCKSMAILEKKQQQNKPKKKKMTFQCTLLLLVMERMAIQILVRHTAGKILSLVHIGQKFRLIFSEIFFSGSVQYIFI